jgi:hypothetical protein
MLNYKRMEAEKSAVYSDIAKQPALRIPEFDPVHKPAKQIPQREFTEKSRSVTHLGER